MPIKSLLISAVLIATATPVLAHAHSGIDQRQAKQERRIEQGVRNGRLTPAEARRLERSQAQIQRMKYMARADGRVTPRERARIREAQNRQNRMIYRQKHDWLRG